MQPARLRRDLQIHRRARAGADRHRARGRRGLERPRHRRRRRHADQPVGRGRDGGNLSAFAPRPANGRAAPVHAEEDRRRRHLGAGEFRPGDAARIRRHGAGRADHPYLSLGLPALLRPAQSAAGGGDRQGGCRRGGDRPDGPAARLFRPAARHRAARRQGARRCSDRRARDLAYEAETGGRRQTARSSANSTRSGLSRGRGRRRTIM